MELWKDIHQVRAQRMAQVTAVLRRINVTAQQGSDKEGRKQAQEAATGELQSLKYFLNRL